MDLKDLSLAGEYAKSSIIESVKARIIKGYTDQTFKPKRNATRAETTVILLNLLKSDPELKEILE